MNVISTKKQVGETHYDLYPEHKLLLKAGTITLVSFLKPEDREELVRDFEKLSAQSRYQRFLIPLTELSAKQLTYLTEIDNKDHLALSAYDVTQTPKVGIGVARYVRLIAEPHVAEIAITILDEYHGKGLGTQLFKLLIQYARENGISNFRAYVFGENIPMMTLLRHYNPRISHEEGSLFRVDIALEGFRAF
ncbi:MAG: GNAT family N-acetyltransferase [Candidatus Hodarchaeota archaeon]